MGKNNDFRGIAGLFVTGIFLVFLVYPLMSVFLSSFSGQNFSELIFSNLPLIWNSLYQAFFSTVFSILFGIPLAFVLAKRNFPGKTVVKSLSLVPFVFPSILVVLSFVIVFGNNGWINNFLAYFFGFETPVKFIYGFSGIILAHIFYNFPLVAKFVSESWENIDYEMEEAAKSLGASPITVFLKITLPQLVPSILAAGSLVFIYTFMSFAIVITLGGIQFTTLEVEIYRLITRNLDFAAGSALALVQFLILSAVVFVYFYFSKKYSISSKGNQFKKKNINLFSSNGFTEALIIVFSVLFIMLPLSSIFIFAFSEPSTGSFSVASFIKIFSANESVTGSTAINSVFYSLLIAFISGIFATFIGLLAGISKEKISPLLVIFSSSVAISIITLAFGYYLSFGSGLWIIIAGHAIVAFPFSFRIINNSLDKISNEIVLTARTLGADQIKVFSEIQFPRIKKAIITSVIFSFAVSLGELGLVLVLYDGIYATMPVYIYRLISSFDLHAAAAMGVVLISLSFISFYLIEKISPERTVF